MAWKPFHRLDTVGEPQIFRNYSPLLMWVLAPVWVVAIGRVAYTVNLAHTLSIFRISFTGGLFLASCAMAVACLRKPLLTISVGPDRVAIRETWLWRSRESYYAAAELSEPEIIQVDGGEGGPSFQCHLRLPGGRTLLVTENSNEGAARMDRYRLQSALDRYRTPEKLIGRLRAARPGAVHWLRYRR